MRMGFLCKKGAFVEGEEEVGEIVLGSPKLFIAPAIRLLCNIPWSSTEASWTGCRWGQEQGVAAVCSQMFELALVSKIQELTAWRCLGAQCFLQGRDHWGWAQSLPFSARVDFGTKQISHQPAECPETSLERWKLCLSIASRAMCWGLSLNPKDTATRGKISSFPHLIPSLGMAFFIQYQLERVACAWTVPAWTCWTMGTIFLQKSCREIQHSVSLACRSKDPA